VKVGIVGLGAVGKGIASLFPDAVHYDEPKGIGTRADINKCDVVFVCVPTPPAIGGRCDTSIVEEVVGWLDGPLGIIRSTVAVGTTRRLVEKYGTPLVFQPEYGPAETPDHPFSDLRKIRWIILGGDRAHTKRAARAWQDAYSSDVTIMLTSYEAAELCKYMENAFLATKLTFCNEFFDLATAVGVDYEELRELWLQDPRIGRSHTFVYPDNRGFAGRCLPKDLDAVIAIGADVGVDVRLLQAVATKNAELRRRE
jgi:UDPglucose 6-dehydrogenase